MTNEELQKAIDKLYEIYNNERSVVTKKSELEFLQNFIRDNLMRLIEAQVIRATQNLITDLIEG